MWKKLGTVVQAAYNNIIRRMLIACQITKATNTHSEYVILIPFPQQPWLLERASLSRYTYIASHFYIRVTDLAVSDRHIIHTPEDESI